MKSNTNELNEIGLSKLTLKKNISIDDQLYSETPMSNEP